MKTALVSKNDIVVNIIILDPKDDYTPADGLRLEQVNDWINLGDTYNAAQPQPKPKPTEEERKAARDAMAKQDLAILACYNNEKKTSPSLSFSAYLDYLESVPKPPL